MMILRILIDVIKTSLITDTSSLLHNRNRLFLCLKLRRNVSKTNVLLILILYEPQKRGSTNEPFCTIQSFDLLFFIYICSKLKSGNSDHTLNFLFNDSYLTFFTRALSWFRLFKIGRSRQCLFSSTLRRR